MWGKTRESFKAVCCQVSSVSDWATATARIEMEKAGPGSWLSR